MNVNIKGEFILWGARGHGKVLRSVIESYGASIVAIVDNDPAALGGVQKAIPLLGADGLRKFVSGWSGANLSGAIAVGGGRASDRLAILSEFLALGISLPPIIDRSAVQESGSTVSVGCQLLAGSILGADATLGQASILNHNVVVDHECIIGSGVHIAPSATLCGCVSVEDGVFIGAGATILPRLKIGANATIAAGAVVTRNVEAGQTVVGVPAVNLNKNVEAVRS